MLNLAQKIRIHSIGILVICIFLLGIFLRLYQIEERIPWEPDGARDTLVAKHIAEYNDPLVGPESTGSRGLMQGSPFYFALLSFVWRFTHSPQKLVYFFALSDSLGIILMFLIGRLSGRVSSGLISALLYAISPVLITQAKAIWQPTLIPMLVLVNLYALIKSRHSPAWIVVLSVLVFLPLHIYFSYLPIFVVTLITLVYYLFTRYRKKLNIIFLVCVNIVIQATFLVILTARQKPFDQIDFFDFLRRNFHLFSPHHNITTIWSQIINLAYPYQNISGSQLIIVFIVIGLICIVFIRNEPSKNVNGILSLYFASTGIICYYPDPVLNFRVNAYVPVIYLITLNIIFAIKRKWLSTTLTIFIILSLSWSTNAVFSQKPENQFLQVHNLTKRIYEDYRVIPNVNQNGSDVLLFSIEDSSDQAHWYTAQYWYLWEIFFKTKLVTLKQNGNNIKPLAKNPKLIYLICPLSKIPGSEKQDQCLTMFTTYINDHTLYSAFLEKVEPLKLHPDFITLRFSL